MLFLLSHPRKGVPCIYLCPRCDLYTALQWAPFFSHSLGPTNLCFQDRYSWLLPASLSVDWMHACLQPLKVGVSGSLYLVHWSTSKAHSQIHVPVPNSGYSILTHHLVSRWREILTGLFEFQDIWLLPFPPLRKRDQCPNQNPELILSLEPICGFWLDHGHSLLYSSTSVQTSPFQERTLLAKPVQSPPSPSKLLHCSVLQDPIIK